MSTQGIKAFKKPETCYLSNELTQDILIDQIAATKKLYELLATHYECKDFDKVDFQDPKAVNSFLKKLYAAVVSGLNDKILDSTETPLKKLSKVINEWFSSNEFKIANKHLKNPLSIEPEKLADTAIKKYNSSVVNNKGKNEKIVDTIAISLGGQPCAGYMPFVNGEPSPNNATIDDMHIRSTIAEIEFKRHSYAVYTEGCDSKSEDFTNDLQQEIDFASAIYFKNDNILDLNKKNQHITKPSIFKNAPVKPEISTPTFGSAVSCLPK
jgi:hypothetical protein